tara:strand:- start:14067 stop:17246 length:3180 start_codon:yes stop_codon:yes gene_type:complete
MPKQIFKIDQFHGGLNNNSDPRDIADNELSEAIDVGIDFVGKMRPGYGNTDISTPSTTALTIVPGYGIFPFRHDRLYAQQDSVELLSDGDFLSSDNWSVDNFTQITTSISAACMHYNDNSPDNGYFEQTVGNMTTADDGSTNVINGGKYLLRFQLTVTDKSTYHELKLLAADGFVASDTTIWDFEADVTNFKSEVIEKEITLAADAADDTTNHKFKLHLLADQGGTSSGTLNFKIDNISLTVTSFANSTGDNYLALADDPTSGDAELHIYSYGQNIWGDPDVDVSPSALTAINPGWTPVFYMADGNIRIGDGNHSNGTNSSNQWYGYIIRNRFQYIGRSDQLYDREYSHHNWWSTDQEIKAPTTGDTSTNGHPASLDIRPLFNTANAGTWPQATIEFAKSNIYDYNQESPLYTFVAPYEQIIASANREFSGGDNWANGAGSNAFNSFSTSGGNLTVTSAFDVSNTKYCTLDEDYFNVNSTDLTYRAMIVGSRYRLTYDINVSSHTIGTLSVGIGNDSFGLTDHINTYAGTTNTTGTIDFTYASTDTKIIVHAATSAAFTASFDNFSLKEIENTPSSTGQQLYRLNFNILALNNSNSAYHIDNRITGNNIYWREKDGEDSTWYFLAYVDFYYGASKSPHILSTESSYAHWRNFSSDNAHQQSLAAFNWIDPPKLYTYETLSGLPQETTSLYCKYQTAVVAKRKTYAANLTIKEEDGSTVVRSDAMIKTPANKFDTFSKEYLMEVSIEDGDEIIKLEEYGDRILQFKRHKLHIINISQEIEFLEETIHDRGVAHQNAVFKIPGGIVWCNSSGVYLYDGQQINDLFVKNGIRLISASDWTSFYTENSLVGYVPKLKMIVISRDCSGGSDTGDIYMYDMTLQAWTFGNSILEDDGHHTNFAIDKNNDLIWARMNSTNVDFYKFNTSPAATTNFKVITKDFDFGYPGVRKKIYKIYVTYRGQGTAIDVLYGTNGKPPSTLLGDNHFLGTNSDGSSTNANPSGGADHPLLHVDGEGDGAGWVTAELKPVLSINNIYSFQLLFSGTTSADFEINDISIVYRLKSIK